MAYSLSSYFHVKQINWEEEEEENNCTELECIYVYMCMFFIDRY